MQTHRLYILLKVKLKHALFPLLPVALRLLPDFPPVRVITVQFGLSGPSAQVVRVTVSFTLVGWADVKHSCTVMWFEQPREARRCGETPGSLVQPRYVILQKSAVCSNSLKLYIVCDTFSSKAGSIM